MFTARGTVDPTASGGRPVRWAATSRLGGLSLAPFDSLNLAGDVGDAPAAVAANHALLAEGLGLAPDRICFMDSVHGAEIADVVAGGVVTGVDALITRTPGLALVALGADCVPIALVGADGATVVAAHCGWRGLVADVVGVAVAALREQGTDVALAVLGPSVCGRCYPVPPERAIELRDSLSAAVGSPALVVTADGQPGIDVRAGLRCRLLELDVAAAAILDAGGCTVEDASLFSYRRDGVTGRQGMAVLIEPLTDLG